MLGSWLFLYPAPTKGWGQNYSPLKNRKEELPFSKMINGSPIYKGVGEKATGNANMGLKATTAAAKPCYDPG